MISALFWAITATIIVSLISFIGVLTLAFKEKLLNKIVLLLVGFSAGALIGGAFLHLIPEALEKYASEALFLYVILGFVAFYVLEKVLHWRHCHKGKCDVHVFTYLNLVGDAIHNFMDGLVIAASFVVNTNLGVVTTAAVIAHEIPQEFGDFGVLIYGGFGKMKALFYNFLSGLTAVAGAVAGYVLSSTIQESTMYLLPLTAGGFIYIASSDLIPELRKETDIKKSIMPFIFFLLGLAFMWAAKILLE
ncbi:MAG: ZIP family metal transporter [Nanoarchaeota archaeon]|nr:ZIP family metal transporter [Nanoarchaeota archaeon]